MTTFSHFTDQCFTCSEIRMLDLFACILIQHICFSPLMYHPFTNSRCTANFSNYHVKVFQKTGMWCFKLIKCKNFKIFLFCSLNGILPVPMVADGTGISTPTEVGCGARRRKWFVPGDGRVEGPTDLTQKRLCLVRQAVLWAWQARQRSCAVSMRRLSSNRNRHFDRQGMSSAPIMCQGRVGGSF